MRDISGIRNRWLKSFRIPHGRRMVKSNLLRTLAARVSVQMRSYAAGFGVFFAHVPVLDRHRARAMGALCRGIAQPLRLRGPHG